MHLHIMTYPDWVLKQKRKGTLIMRREDRYYLYRVSSHWNKEKKKPQLKTEEYLGRITPDGLIEPKAKRIMKRYDQIAVKEYGAAFLLHSISKDLFEVLRELFPEWKEILVFACMRLLHRSAMKNVEFHYRSSFLSELIHEAHVSPDVLGDLLRSIGIDRTSMIAFMRAFMSGDRYLAVDLTHVLSMSEGVISATLGHNSSAEFLPQIQLLFLFSLDHDSPAYFRILPGSATSVISLRSTMEESGVRKIVLVADSGFYSAKNVSSLEGARIHYIIPLKRNSRLIDYSDQGKHFTFQDHPIFHAKYKSGERTIHTFRNDFLRAEEEKDYLRRKKSGFDRVRERMGTISVITDLHVSGEIIYTMLKSRADIEQSYDTFKNCIHGDRTYMRDDYQLQGWMFVNFIALMLHYRIYGMLKVKDLLRKYSPDDILEHMQRVHMLKIGDEWKMSEIPKHTREVIEKLEIPIMQKSGS